MSIGEYAFFLCSSLGKVTIPNSVTTIGEYAFPRETRCYATNGSATVIELWKANCSVYDEQTQRRLYSPTLGRVTTQTTAKFWIDDYNANYKYQINGEEQTDLQLSNLYPGYSGTISFKIAEKNSSNWYDFGNITFYTKSLSPSISAGTTASSLSLNCSYEQGDANITSQKLSCNDKTYDIQDGKPLIITGLNPDKSYEATYTIIANDHTYTKTETYTTPPLTLTTRQPKVVSAGNVIVAAASNVSDEETNVGFEWRRTDWSDDFASNTGTAYVYTDATANTNMIEGYIRNLNTEKLWKYRPYYLADDGTYYYGDWVGLDPTNTSYFEPTVHTYAKVDIQGNTALVKGYALRGSDNVVVKGFMYWKTANRTTPQLLDVSIPSNAQTQTVSGSSQIMTANLTGLDYDADYSYVSFMTTSEGDTYYGEVQTFRTEPDITGINEVVTEQAPAAAPTRTGIYTLSGVKISDDSNRLHTLPAGVYIVNGKKVVKK